MDTNDSKREDRSTGVPSRRDILQVSGTTALLTGLAGCNQLLGGDEPESTTTAASGTTAHTDPTGDEAAPPVYAIDPAALTSEGSTGYETLFSVPRHALIEARAGSGDTMQLVAYGHDPTDPDDILPYLGAPSVSAGVLSVSPDDDAEHPLRDATLRTLLGEPAGRAFRQSIGLRADLEVVAGPTRLLSEEGTALDSAVTIEAFLIAVPVPAEASRRPYAHGSGSSLQVSQGMGVGLATVYAARVRTGTAAVLVGMVDGWERPPSATPEREELGASELELLAEANQAVRKATLFRRSLGALTRWGGALDETPPAPRSQQSSTSPSHSPAGLTAGTRVDLGYPQATTTTFTRTTSFIEGRSSWSVRDGWNRETFQRGTEYTIDITSTVRAYPVPGGDNTYPVVVVTSPMVERAGEQRNPFYRSGFADLLTGVDGAWLRETVAHLGLYSNQRSIEWVQGPTREEQGTNYGWDSFDWELFSGQVRPFGSSSGPVKDLELVAARTVRFGDIVLVLVPNVLTGTEYWDDRSHAKQMFDWIDNGMTFGPSQPTAVDRIDIRDLRLVQTVTNTRVEDGTSTIASVDDPPLVVGENVAPVFDFQFHSTVSSSTDMPFRSIVEIDVANWPSLMVSEYPITETWEIGRPGNDPASALHEIASGGAANPTVFTLGSDSDSVTARAKAPSGYEYGNATISAGSDYTIRQVEPLAVGFISVTDPDNGPNYGNSAGEAENYQTSVGSAIEYLYRTYPGRLYAYRHDNPITGHRKGAGFGEYKDFGDAEDELEQVAASSAFPSNGQVTGRGASDSTARNYISSNGFDVAVLIAPTGYFGFHGQDADGLGTPREELAVAVEDQPDNPHDREWAAQVTAQEIGHQFVDKPYDIPGPNGNYPYAQRDDEGTTRDITGGLAGDIDEDHARHKDSDNDPDTPTDAPGVASDAFDLTDGTFKQVDDFDVAPGSFSVYNPEPMAVRPKESYMSYNVDDSLWADAVMHRQLIDVSWTASARQGGVFSGMAVEREEGGPLEFVSMREGTMKPLTESVEGGNVLVEMVDYQGETVASRRVSDEITAHHVPDPSGLIAVQFEFPLAAVRLRTTRDGSVSTANPIVGVLRDAVSRVPVRGFADDPDATRDRLNSILSEMAGVMPDQQYATAREYLLQFIEEVRASVRTEYESAANEPVRAELVALAERMETRLLFLEESTA